MEILYVGAFRMPNMDAASARVLNNAKAFRSSGYSVRFISWGGKYQDSDLCDDSKYRSHGFEYIITNELDCNKGFLFKLKQRLLRGCRSMRIIRQMKKKPDIIILYNAEFFWTLRILLFCKRYNIRLIHDITEWFSNDELHLTDILPNYLNMTFLQRRVKNKILISSYLNNYYSESNNIILPPLCDKYDTKWNGVLNDDNRIDEFDGITLIYAGSPLKKDYLHVIVNAVERLISEGEKIRLLVLGVNKEKYTDDYSDLLTTRHLHDNIKFLGRVSQDVVPAYYQKADFMVLIRQPSRKSHAGFPTKVAESITAGIPVITNDTSDLKTFVIDFKTGFIVDGYDENSLIDCIKNKVLISTRSSIEEMKRITKDSNKGFDYRTYSTRVSAFLERIR